MKFMGMTVGLGVVVTCLVASGAMAQDCDQTIDCIVDCGENESCMQGCLQQASPEALALVQCILESQCDSDECLQSKCGGPLAACGVAGPAPGGEGGEGGAGGGDCPPGVTFEGSCSGQVLEYCENGEHVVLDCGAEGGTCGFASDLGYYVCQGGEGGANDGGAACPDGTTYEGSCSGSVLSFCHQGETVSVDCGTEGLTCAYNGEEAYYDCLEAGAGGQPAAPPAGGGSGAGTGAPESTEGGGVGGLGGLAGDGGSIAGDRPAATAPNGINGLTGGGGGGCSQGANPAPLAAGWLMVFALVLFRRRALR